MRRGRPGKKLNAALKAEADRIYTSDKIRYRRLVNWIWWAQKAGWPDEAIAECLRLANGGIKHAQNWWSYLTYLLPKAKARAFEQEADSFKRDDINSVRAILKDIING